VCKITVVDQFGYNASVVFGLEVEAPAEECPLVVGCSLRTTQGDIIDQPARWLSSAGLALWEIKATPEFKIGQHREDGWRGQVIFALWPDDRFSRRLADTGWLPCSAYWLVGASTAGLDMQDDNVRRKYDGRFGVWSKPI
jgi:hypothetical protein